MVTTDTVEGQINGTVSYHYDVFADVLYLRLVSDMETPSIGEETDGGDIELHEELTGRLIGIRHQLVEAFRPGLTAGFAARTGGKDRTFRAEGCGLIQIRANACDV